MFFPYSNRDQTDPLTFPTNIYINIDKHDIGFVNEFRLLGVTIDNKLNFDPHIRNTISKVNSKTFILLLNLKSFPQNFRSTLFKLFIVPIFDYCSTTFIHLGNKTRRNRLQHCFNRSIKRLINVQLDGLCEEEQLKLLKPFNILPLFYRQFYHFCCFIIIVLKNTNLDINKSLLERKTTRDNYEQPIAKTSFMQNSFVNISVKTLNLFLDKLFFDSIKAKYTSDTVKKALKVLIESKDFKFCNILYDNFQQRFLT